jgi:hypothetical protein
MSNSPLLRMALMNTLEIRRQGCRRVVPVECCVSKAGVDRTLIHGSILAVAPTSCTNSILCTSHTVVDDSDDCSAQQIAQVLRHRLVKVRLGKDVPPRKIEVIRVADSKSAQCTVQSGIAAAVVDRWAWLSEDHKALLLWVQKMLGQLQRSGAPEEQIRSILEQVHAVVASKGTRSTAQLTRMTQFSGCDGAGGAAACSSREGYSGGETSGKTCARFSAVEMTLRQDACA